MTYIRSGLSIPLTRHKVTIPAVYSVDDAANFGCRRAVRYACKAIAEHNDTRLLFSVKDEDGLALDISTASEITVYIARHVRATPDLTFTLTGGTVVLGIGSQFYVDLSVTQSGSLTPGRNYYEATVEYNGSVQTVAAGQLYVQDTIYGDS